ncbi:MltA domain-containing protein [Phenylobacterium sp. SCN 70-31]|uniref:MltA domain-containing protein n=1 Tax=Phenylobacterium sp. SCN 70-31 TaxID=1660129 RepID=UPI00086B7EBA|nr:MltA domain-containing protein [Phenylobacterium sp. SCN 70-31]ODT87770.1 MAG: transglycosylase [Phenylobacterium sp. SCN 70-31]
MRWGVWAAGLAALSLAACATRSEHGPPPPGFPPPGLPQPEAPAPRPTPVPEPQRIPLSQLPGWSEEDHDAAFAAWRATCQVSKAPATADLCARARAVRDTGPGVGRAFLEAFFEAERAPGDGVLTAYFAPEYAARSRPDREFSAPLRPRPADLAPGENGTVWRIRPDGVREPYPDRAAVETAAESPSSGTPLAWMRPEELFFLQIQGSGVLVMEDGRRMKALYAAHNGRPFVGVANPMRDRGLLARDNTSGEAIRAWLAANRGPAADEIMRLNPRYVFFRLAPDDGRPPVGAAGLPLPRGRAVAIDPAFHGYGGLVWLDAEAPLLAGAFPRYRRLVATLDTGGAIRGEVRADLYLGEGDAAGLEAGRVRHTLRLWRLVPRSAAAPP